ncbi:MAG: adenosylmethionine decarboxylase [Proteobacteria bacterium]|nr:adenosylmethionine decarboxylase [Pseudomonadota bacterium]
MAYDDALFQLGMDLTRSSTAQKEDLSEKTAHIAHTAEDREDFVSEKRDGVRFAGTHLIIDLFGARRLDDLKHIERLLKRCVDVVGAKLLHIHVHHVSPEGGVTGVAVLAEGHINIRTWPERGFAAVDMLYMAKHGSLRSRVVETLEQSLAPSEVVVKVSKRVDSSRAEERVMPRMVHNAEPVAVTPRRGKVRRAA